MWHPSDSTKSSNALDQIVIELCDLDVSSLDIPNEYVRTSPLARMDIYGCSRCNLAPTACFRHGLEFVEEGSFRGLIFIWEGPFSATFCYDAVGWRPQQHATFPAPSLFRCINGVISSNIKDDC